MYNTNQTINKVHLIGRLGDEPVFKLTTKGTPVMRLSIATQAKMPDGNGGWQVTTQWHRVIVFGRDANFFRDKLHKGMLVSVTGFIVYKRVVSSDTGAEYRFTDIYTESIQCLSKMQPVKTVKVEQIELELSTPQK